MCIDFQSILGPNLAPTSSKFDQKKVENILKASADANVLDDGVKDELDSGNISLQVNREITRKCCLHKQHGMIDALPVCNDKQDAVDARQRLGDAALVAIAYLQPFA